MYTGELLKNSKKLLELPPHQNNYERIDRSNMVFNENLLTNQYYIDFHAPRPYEKHQTIIETIINKIPQYEQN